MQVRARFQRISGLAARAGQAAACECFATAAEGRPVGVSLPVRPRRRRAHLAQRRGRRARDQPDVLIVRPRARSPGFCLPRAGRPRLAGAAGVGRVGRAGRRAAVLRAARRARGRRRAGGEVLPGDGRGRARRRADGAAVGGRRGLARGRPGARRRAGQAARGRRRARGEEWALARLRAVHRVALVRGVVLPARARARQPAPKAQLVCLCSGAMRNRPQDPPGYDVCRKESSVHMQWRAGRRCGSGQMRGCAAGRGRGWRSRLQREELGHRQRQRRQVARLH